ncbi:putative phenylacetic acid degradation-related protein [Acrocarpospora phusangensis]|uniref:Phenylacetic acid degradation-related protein n=1 Tax=Acrocarpospora phusangensis TaxID=1070424 RepID=A0A919UM88_9ACTN|nr:PaaI family thioesterase [Acrocarpospora phusangensis]GIH26734.1 putative phenylacetic acid degradation-related protein [Acrocarpospora phusangensis]
MTPDNGAARPTPAPRDGHTLPTADDLTAITEGRLPGLLGFRVTTVAATELTAELDIRPDLLAPNGYLHAATVVALADTACGFGCRVALPHGATGFTTLELKTSYLATAREGTLHAHAQLRHNGRQTQIWDATITDSTSRTLALFRCTQLILWPRT